MNIFALDIDPVIAARKMRWKKHLVKMPTESAQMLSMALRVQYNDIDNKNFNGFINQYVKTYASHPCTKWVLESSANFMWLYQHSLELCRLYKIVYDKSNDIASKETIENCQILFHADNFTQHELTPFYCAMPVMFYKNKLYKTRQSMEDAIYSYNRYYNEDKLAIRAKPYDILNADYLMNL